MFTTGTSLYKLCIKALNMKKKSINPLWTQYFYPLDTGRATLHLLTKCKAKCTVLKSWDLWRIQMHCRSLIDTAQNSRLWWSCFHHHNSWEYDLTEGLFIYSSSHGYWVYSGAEHAFCTFCFISCMIVCILSWYQQWYISNLLIFPSLFACIWFCAVSSHVAVL